MPKTYGANGSSGMIGVVVAVGAIVSLFGTVGLLFLTFLKKRWGGRVIRRSLATAVTVRLNPPPTSI